MHAACTRKQVPKDAFELNFVLCDAEGLYENNGGQDFMFPVIEGISRERWAEIAAEIAAKKLAERMVSDGRWRCAHFTGRVAGEARVE